ncbi:protein SLX4IP [Salvelinus alpinus]|uniref:protein SLX4IP n=1 Tax=Salvelinus alpinus TaxID=8036 RepID=UPI0039FBF7A5
MASHKVVVKCGSYAVLLDLQIIGPLGRGAAQETSWVTMEHIEEVTSLVRDTVDRRVRLYIDCLHKRGQPKHKRELPRANPLCVKALDAIVHPTGLEVWNLSWSVKPEPFQLLPGL